MHVFLFVYLVDDRINTAMPLICALLIYPRVLRSSALTSSERPFGKLQDRTRLVDNGLLFGTAPCRFRPDTVILKASIMEKQRSYAADQQCSHLRDIS